MIEVAIVSMEEALEADGEAAPGRLGRRSSATRWCSPGSRSAAGSARPRSRGGRVGAPVTLDPPLPGHDRRDGRDRPRLALAEVARQYDDVQAELAPPETSTDLDALRRLGRELARLGAGRRGASAASNRPGRELAGARELRDASDGDDELRQMATDEIDRLTRDEAPALDDLKVLLLPRDPNDDRDVIMEIRAGAGGEEAALFAGELLRMYLRYAGGHKFTPEVLSLNETGIERREGGDRPDPRRRRLQPPQVRGRRPPRPARSRRPESCGRIHTSTATVVVMPEADEVEIEIDEEQRPPDRRQALVRAGRPVGQHHRLGGPHHPPADGPRRRDPGREEPAQEQGQGDVGAALAAATTWSWPSSARQDSAAAAVDGRRRRPIREDPDLQLPAGPRDRPPDRARPVRRCRGSWTATSTG